MRLSFNTVPLLMALACLVLAGCGSKLPTIKSYQMEVQQGNVVTSKMLLQLRPGMTKSQVRYIMGTPLVVDSFHTNRWDYFYKLRQQGKIVETRRVILDFENDLLKAVRGDVVAATGKSENVAVDTSARSVSPPKPEEASSWLDALMFWKRKPAEAVPEVVAPAQSLAPAVAKTAMTDEAASVKAAQTAEEAPASLLRQSQGALMSTDTPTLPAVPVLSAVPATETLAQATAPERAPAVATAVQPVELEVSPSVARVDMATVAPVPQPQQAQSKASEMQEAEIRQAVMQWADAWRTKQVSAYLGAYDPNFKPEGGLSKKAWEAQRKQRLSPKQGAISLVIEDMQIATKDGQASVTFWQQYQSRAYSDQVTKQLDLVYDEKAKRWLIAREFVVSNAKRPQQQTISAPEATSEHLEGVIEQIGF